MIKCNWVENWKHPYKKAKEAKETEKDGCVAALWANREACKKKNIMIKEFGFFLLVLRNIRFLWQLKI